MVNGVANDDLDKQPTKKKVSFMNVRLIFLVINNFLKTLVVLPRMKDFQGGL